MKQTEFSFEPPVRTGKRSRQLGSRWAEIIAADPVRYPGITQRLAALCLHRVNQQHSARDCLLCQQSKNSLDCYRCGITVEIEPGCTSCPGCGAPLDIQWNAAARSVEPVALMTAGVSEEVTNAAN